MNRLSPSTRGYSDRHELTELLDHLGRHLERCDVGPARCLDCSLLHDMEAQSAITVARSEARQVARFIRRFPRVCVYCGEDAAHLDHLVPKPWTGPEARKFVPTVPSCADCNTRLGPAAVFTIGGRCGLIAASIRRTRKKQLAIPDRDDDWFAELGPRMAANLRKAQLERRVLRHRLVVLDAMGAANVPEDLLLAV